MKLSTSSPWKIKRKRGLGSAPPGWRSSRALRAWFGGDNSPSNRVDHEQHNEDTRPVYLHPTSTIQTDNEQQAESLATSLTAEPCSPPLPSSTWTIPPASDTPILLSPAIAGSLPFLLSAVDAHPTLPKLITALNTYTTLLARIDAAHARLSSSPSPCRPHPSIDAVLATADHVLRTNIEVLERTVGRGFVALLLQAWEEMEMTEDGVDGDAVVRRGPEREVPSPSSPSPSLLRRGASVVIVVEAETRNSRSATREPRWEEDEAGELVIEERRGRARGEHRFRGVGIVRVMVRDGPRQQQGEGAMRYVCPLLALLTWFC